MSRQQTSQASDHEIKFVTPSGVDAPTDTITLEFQTGFDLSAVGFGDIDLAIDADGAIGDCSAAPWTDKALAATANATDWGAHVSGQVLTLTPPTGAALGEIPAGSCVRVLIGKNASGGSANSQIVNPASSGSYVITLSGGFGDGGTAAVAIDGGDQVTVTASVSGTGGGGGGGNINNGQCAPGTIINIRTANLAETSIDVVWDTDIASSSTVDYGTALSYGSSATAAGSTFNHDVSLTGLTPGTLYHYRVRSAVLCGTETASGDLTFTTKDATAPVMSGIGCKNVTGTSFTVAWDTDEDTDSKVSYGFSEPYPDFVYDAAPTNSHSLDLNGLAPSSTYKYRTSSKDAAGNVSTSAEFTCTTLDTVPPAISNVRCDNVTADSFLVDWTTDELSDSRVDYGLTDAYTAAASNSSLVANHQVALSALRPATTYHYKVTSHDAASNATSSGDVFCETLGDTTPPANIQGFTASACDRQVTLNWTPPPDADFSGTKIQRAADGNPTTPTSGTTVYDSNGSSYVDAGLPNGITQHYTAFAYDTSGNFASGNLLNATPNISASPLCPVRPAACGNGLCEAGENGDTCPADCQVQPTHVCGNAICESGETPEQCPADCSAQPSKPSAQTLSLDAVGYFAMGRTLPLQQDSSGSYRILPVQPFSVRIQASGLPKPVDTIVLDFDGGSFLFAKDAAGEYWSDVTSPGRAGTINGSITLNYSDQTRQTIGFQVRVDPLGLIYETVGGTRTAVSGAAVTLRKMAGGWTDWDGTPYRQSNPVRSDGQGHYGFMVPPGQYQIEVDQNGYRTYVSPAFSVSTDVVDADVELIAIPPPEFIVPGQTLTENIGNVARGLAAQGSYVTKIVQKEFVERPEVKSAITQIIVPTAAVVTATTFATAVQAASFLNYIYYLFTQPLLLLARRRRKEFGTVYNALTKRPVDLAIVRLIRSATGKLVRTLVTDKQGRYAFLVDSGEYRIEVSKQGFTFPTRYLSERKEDGRFFDLYHAETIKVGEKGAIITANIPMDPIEEIKTVRRIIWEDVGRRIQDSLSILSVLLTLIAALFYRLTYLYVLLVVQISVYLVFRRLARPGRSKNWGIIYDARTKKPVPFAVARIVETQYNKVLESRVTDSKGRYNFLVGNNKYVVTVEKPGYEDAKTDEIDLTQVGKEGGVVSKDIPIQERTEKT